MFDPSFDAPVYSFRRGSRGFPSNEIWLVRPSGRAFGHEGRLAQLVRAPALQAGGRRFESCTAHHFQVFGFSCHGRKRNFGTMTKNVTWKAMRQELRRLDATHPSQ